MKVCKFKCEDELERNLRFFLIHITLPFRGRFPLQQRDISNLYFFLDFDAKAFPGSSSYPCQGVSLGFIVSDFEIAIASPCFANFFQSVCLLNLKIIIFLKMQVHIAVVFRQKFSV